MKLRLQLSLVLAVGFAAFIFVCLPAQTQAATRTISNSGGNYNATSTWVEGIVPTSSDDVVATGTSGQLTVNVSSAAKTINFTGYTNTLTMSNTLTVSGTTTLASAMTIAGSGTLTINAAGTLTSNGKTWPNSLTINTGAVTITLADSWTVGGTLTLASVNSSGPTINGNSFTVNGGFTIANSGNCFGSIGGTTSITLAGTGTWSQPSAGCTSSNTTDLQNNITINTSGTITMSGTLYHSGTLTYTTGTVVTTGSTFIMNKHTGTTVPAGITWNNLWIGPQGNTTVTFTLAGDVTVNGTLTLFATNSSTLNVNGYTFYVAGSLVIGNSGNCGDASGVYGTTNIVMNGTGTWSRPNSCTGTDNTEFKNNLTINTSGTITISGIVYYSGNTLRYTAGTVTTTGSTLRVGADSTLDTDGITWNNVTLVGTQTLSSNLTVGGTLTIAGDTTFEGSANLVFGASSTWSGSSAVAFAGGLTLASGMTNSYTGDITFTATSGTKSITSSGKTINSNIIFNGSGGTFQFADALTLGGSKTITVTAGTLDLGGSSVNVGSGLTVSSGGILKLTGGQTITGTKTFSSGSTVIYTGTSSYSGLAAGNSYSTLTFQGSGTWTLTGNLTVSGTLTNNGTLDASSSNYTISVRDWGNTGTFVPRQGTLTITTGGTLSDTDSFYNLTLQASGSTITLGANLTVTNDLTINGSTLDVSASNYTVTVGGDWISEGGAISVSSTIGSSEAYGLGMVEGSDGFARIAYIDADTDALKYVVCTDTGCTDPTITTVADTYGSTPGSQILALGSDGFGRIIHTDADGALQLTRCLDDNCATSNSILIDNNVDNSPGDYGQEVHMGNDGFPRVAYANCGDNSDIHFVRFSGAETIAVNTNLTSVFGVSPDCYPYVEIIMAIGSDGFARLVFQDQLDDGQLKMLRCTNANCTTGVLTELVVSDNLPGYYGSVIKLGSDGFPRIAYVDGDGNYQLHYLVCNDADCTDPTITDLVDTWGDASNGFGMDLTDDDLPSISYETYDDGYIHMINCTTNTCSAYDDVEVDASAQSLYGGSAIYINDEDLPVLVYSGDGVSVEFVYNTIATGTLTPRSGTVTLSGTNQSISGSNSFYNLSKSVSSADTLTFEADSTQTVTGTLTLSGASGQLLSLVSDDPGNQWLLDAGGAAVSYANVSDSDASGGIILTATNSTDGGNNLNWSFPVAASSQSSSGGSGLPAIAYNAIATPKDAQGLPVAFALTINNGSTQTNSPTVTLSFTVGSDTNRIALSEDPSFTNTGIESLIQNKSYTFTDHTPGTKTLYAKFYNSWGQSSAPVSASIVFDPKSKTNTAQPASPTNAQSQNQTTSSNPPAQNTNNNSQHFTRDLKVGSRGADVKDLQVFLNQHGYTLARSGAGSVGKETTLFGLATRAAVIKFQNDHKADILTPQGLKNGNGIFGPATRTLINTMW